ncbi:Copper chaperone [Leucobacter sp. 7(1)]|uniref:heavy-metal-associated domain-containing protein n=1 Tax=Leucobacter sp. 7(1) TaxID=1255613 RepID=UPI00097F34A1|nr:heavy-metal-associated domain-containing protein [Leucobacter sp. 7(1)]MDD2818708.1 heavy-metal-associated domain-containing protein [Candidatus Nanopelagicales bacterium]SJN12035.1 Copper chaperone [Leucobacter sp. 7(1)]
MAEFEFWVNGMTCEHCERAVTAELSALPGIIDVQVDAASGRVNLGHETPVDLNAVESAVEDAGYTVRSWPTTTNA